MPAASDMSGRGSAPLETALRKVTRLLGPCGGGTGPEFATTFTLPSKPKSAVTDATEPKPLQSQLLRR